MEWGTPCWGYPTFGTPQSDLAGDTPVGGTACWGNPFQGVPHLRYPPSDLAGGTSPWVPKSDLTGGYPLPRGVPHFGKQMEYLIRRGRYASCIHAGGLSMFSHLSVRSREKGVPTYLVVGPFSGIAQSLLPGPFQEGTPVRTRTGVPPGQEQDWDIPGQDQDRATPLSPRQDQDKGTASPRSDKLWTGFATGDVSLAVMQ